MNYLLFQNDPCIKDVSEDISRRYPRGSLMRVSGSVFPRTPPPLTDKWVIFVHLSNRGSIQQITQAKQALAFTHFVFITANKSGDIQKFLNDVGFEYEIINNIDIPKSSLVKYVCVELGTTTMMAERIVEKSKVYEPLVIKNVQILAMVRNKQLTNTEIDRYLSDSTFVSFNYLYRYVVLGEGEYTKVIRLVQKYQYGISALCKFLIKKLKRDIEIFDEILEGYLTKENYLIYAHEKKIPSHSLQQAIEFFDKVTLESLYAKLLLFEKLKTAGCVEFIMKGCNQK